MSENETSLGIQKLLVTRWFVPAVLILAVLIAYSNTLLGGFVWDDEHLVLFDSRITKGGDTASLFSADFFSKHDDKVKYGYYRPLVSLSYYLEYRLFGPSAWGFHLTNILMHLGCVLLVFGVGRTLFGKRAGPALAAALLFAVHPVHTESVAWISGRTDVMATLFVLLALFIRMRRPKTRKVPVFIGYSAEVLAVIAALLSKEMAVVYFLLVFLCERRSKPLLRSALAATPFLVLTVLFAAFRLWVLEIETNRLFDGPLHVWFFSAAKTFWLYLGELVWPLPMIAHHMNPHLDQAGWQWALFPILCAAFLALGIAVRKRQPLGFLIAALCASFIPLANIVRISAPTEMGFAMAERFLYLPSVFFCLAVVHVVESLLYKRRRAVALGLLAAVCAAGLVATVVHNRVWRFNGSFYSYTVKQVPDSPVFHGLLAGHKLRSGQLAQAEDEYRRALTLYQKQTGTDHPSFAIGLALTLLERGRPEASLSISVPLEKVMTEHATLAYVVGEAYRRKGEFDEAEGAYVRALSMERDYHPARVGLALVAAERKDHQRALEIYNSLLVHETDFAIVHEATGDLHRRMGNMDLSKASFERAIELNPGSFTAHGSLGALAAEAGDLEEAQSMFARALELNPSFHAAVVSLAVLEAENGNDEEAERRMRSVLEKDARNKEALLNLAILYARTGRVSGARGLLAKLLQAHPEDRVARDVLAQIDAAENKGSDHAE